MIGMTEKARNKVRELTTAKGGEACVRIEVGGSGCRFTYRFAVVEVPPRGDYVIEDDGLRVCFAPSQASALFNVEIDHDGSPDEKGFSVKRLAACG